MAVIGKRIGLDENDDASKLIAERRIFEAEKAEDAAKRQQNMATGINRAAMMAETPYLPETEEAGPLGEIMAASPAGVMKAYERMPVETRPIELIRGTERSYWSPATRQEYGDLRTAMTGFRQRPEAERREPAGGVAGMTPYQAASLGLRAEELGFKQGQAELDYITKGLEKRFTPMADMGKQPTQDQITMETGLLRNEWIKANYSPKEAKKLIARNPVELRPNKKTGELWWFNAYGKPIGGKSTTIAAEVEAGQQQLPEIPALTFDPGAMTTPGLFTDETRAIGQQKTAAQRAKVVEKLRRQYEEENRPPIIGARALGRFKKAFGEREESPYVEPPLRLRGMY